VRLFLIWRAMGATNGLGVSVSAGIERGKTMHFYRLRFRAEGRALARMRMGVCAANSAGLPDDVWEGLRTREEFWVGWTFAKNVPRQRRGRSGKNWRKAFRIDGLGAGVL
jgi:hypothetical protein